jgi:hypothetical protein
MNDNATEPSATRPGRAGSRAGRIPWTTVAAARASAAGRARRSGRWALAARLPRVWKAVRLEILVMAPLCGTLHGKCQSPPGGRCRKLQGIVTQRGRPAEVRAPFGQGYAPTEFGAAHAPFFLDVLCHPQVPYSFTSPSLPHGVRMAVEQPPDVLSAARRCWRYTA